MSSSPFATASARGTGLAGLVVGLCWLAVLFDGLDMFIYGSVLPHLLATGTFGLTADQAGDLGSYATFGMLVGALTAGTVADRIGRKKLMVGCVTLFSLASGLCALAGGVEVFGSAGPSRASASAVCCPRRSAWSPTTPRAAAPPSPSAC